MERLLPEWRVFVRQSDGRGRYFVVTRRQQVFVLASVMAIIVWAMTANVFLLRRPGEIAERVQQLDQAINDLKSAQDRLVVAGNLVNDLTREVNDVHTNLAVLADSHSMLIQDQDTNGNALALAKLHSDLETLIGSSLNDEPPEVEGARKNLHNLRLSLDHLRETYVKALTKTAALADQQTDQVEKSLKRLGIKVDALLEHKSETRGQGGPYVPLDTQAPGENETSQNMVAMLSSLDHWNAVKDVTLALPLAEPLHEEWEMNSPFGARFDPLNESPGVHEGMDMGAPLGTPIYATGEGHVKMAGPYDRYGLTVDVDHGNGFVTRYAHLSQINVHVGQKVTRESVIGLLGNSGRTTGAHLHYEVRIDDVPHNPITYIMAGRDASKAR